MNTKIITAHIIALLFIPTSFSQTNRESADSCFQSISSILDQSRLSICQGYENDSKVIVPPPCFNSLNTGSYFLVEGLHLYDLLSKNGTPSLQFIFSAKFRNDFFGFHFQEIALEIFNSYTILYTTTPSDENMGVVITKIYHENDSTIEKIRSTILAFSDSMENIVIACSGSIPYDAEGLSNRNSYHLSIYSHGILEIHYENWWFSPRHKSHIYSEISEFAIEARIFHLLNLFDSISAIKNKEVIEALILSSSP